jgi:16S rRNA (guanine527-N7)-methyltransferase
VFHVKHEGWRRAAASLGLTLPPGADAKLARYEELLLARGAPMGLIAPGDVPNVRERHLFDCLRAAPLLPAEGAAYDLGSGGGLPGIVLAIARPRLAVTLVEVRRNRAAFLQEVVADLGLPLVRIHARRAETLRERVDRCFARAFKPADVAWSLAEPLLTPEGRLIYWAGASFDPEPLRARVDVRLFRTPALARSGPLAIMARQ